MESVEIVMKVEECFDITIEDKEAEKCYTPRELIEVIMTKVDASWTREQVAEKTREIVIEVLDCKNYREDSRFIEDLGLN